jgi:hypothetical protein
MATPAQLTWIRALIDDRGNPEVEISNANGTQTEFFVAAPPISTATVTVNGAPLTPGTDYTIPPTNDEVILTTPPAINSQVVVRYVRQTFSDDELNGYLDSAGQDFVKDRHIVYQAAIWAVDTLLSGTATAFDFGAGQESFQFSGVFSRLIQLREMWELWLQDNIEEGVLEIAHMHVDSIEPGDIRDDPAGQPYVGRHGLFPDSVGGMGGLDP